MFVDGSVEEVAEDGGEVWCDVLMIAGLIL